MSDYNRHLKREVARLQEENRDLKDEVITLREYVSALQALMDAVDDLDPNIAIIPLLDRILHNAMTVTTSKDGSLLVLDEESEELEFVLVRGDVSPTRLVGQRIPPGKGIAGWVAKKGQPTIVNNARADNRFYPGIDDAFRFQTNSVLAVPIIGHGRVLGVIEVLNKRSGKAFDTADQTLLTLLCRFAGDVLYTITQQPEEQTEVAPGAAEAPPEPPQPAA